MIAPPSVLLASRLPWFLGGAAPAAPWKTEEGAIMFKSFYFFLVSNVTQRGALLFQPKAFYMGCSINMNY